jgi:hypothetical protein
LDDFPAQCLNFHPTGVFGLDDFPAQCLIFHPRGVFGKFPGEGRPKQTMIQSWECRGNHGACQGGTHWSPKWSQQYQNPWLHFSAHLKKYLNMKKREHRSNHME